MTSLVTSDPSILWLETPLTNQFVSQMKLKIVVLVTIAWVLVGALGFMALEGKKP